MLCTDQILVQGDQTITLDHLKIGLNSQKIDGYCSIKRNKKKLVSMRCNHFFGNK
jgi:hypothetical protein